MCSDDGGHRGLVQAALVGAVGHTDVSRLSPGRSPGVLDDPVVSAVSDNEHSVVKLASEDSTAGGQHSSGVRLPLLGVNGDGEGSSGGDEGLHLCLGVGDVLVRRDGGSDGLAGHGLAVVADSGARLVGVGVLSHDLSVVVRDQPLQGVVHQTSVAALVDLVARHKLLLGHRGQGLSGQLPLSLNSSGGGECPARSALCLVLHVGHGTSGPPVLGVGGDGHLLLSEHGRGGLLLLDLHVVVGLELGGGHVGEHVHAELGSLGLLLLETGRLQHVGGEDPVAALLLGDARVLLAVVGLEGVPQKLGVGTHVLLGVPVGLARQEGTHNKGKGTHSRFVILLGFV